MSNTLMVTYFAMKITMTSSLMTGNFDVICDLLLNRRTTTWNLLKAVEGLTYNRSLIAVACHLKMHFRNKSNLLWNRLLIGLLKAV